MLLYVVIETKPIQIPQTVAIDNAAFNNTDNRNNECYNMTEIFPSIIDFRELFENFPTKEDIESYSFYKFNNPEFHMTNISVETRSNKNVTFMNSANYPEVR